MKKKSVILFIADQLLGIAGMAAALFWSAGRVDWPPAWAAVGVWLSWYALMDFLLLRRSPDLLAERLAPPKGAKGWDRAILSVLRLSQLARYILAGLDQRWGWTSGFPLFVQAAAPAACVLGYALFEWAMASNPFFSQIVRIQTDRGHTVATGGPYRWVRHPGYAAMIVFELAISAVFASWWALLAGGGCALLFVLRTILEDRTLRVELSGYAEYAQRVRFRLLPGIW